MPRKTKKTEDLDNVDIEYMYTEKNTGKRKRVRLVVDHDYIVFRHPVTGKVFKIPILEEVEDQQ